MDENTTYILQLVIWIIFASGMYLFVSIRDIKCDIKNNKEKIFHLEKEISELRYRK